MKSTKSKKPTVARKPKVNKEQNLLQDALRDLEGELRSLRSLRSGMEQKVRLDSKSLSNTQERELEIQNKLNNLKRQENLLIKKTHLTKEKLDIVIKRMEKIKTVERQLEEV